MRWLTDSVEDDSVNPAISTHTRLSAVSPVDSSVGHGLRTEFMHTVTLTFEQLEVTQRTEVVK